MTSRGFPFHAATIAALFLSGAAMAASPAVTTGKVDVREGPGKQYRRSGTLSAGEGIAVHTCIPGYKWCDIDWSGGRGWILGKSISVLRQEERQIQPQVNLDVEVPVQIGPGGGVVSGIDSSGGASGIADPLQPRGADDFLLGRSGGGGTMGSDDFLAGRQEFRDRRDRRGSEEGWRDHRPGERSDQGNAYAGSGRDDGSNGRDPYGESAGGRDMRAYNDGRSAGYDGGNGLNIEVQPDMMTGQSGAGSGVIDLRRPLSR